MNEILQSLKGAKRQPDGEIPLDEDIDFPFVIRLANKMGIDLIDLIPKAADNFHQLKVLFLTYGDKRRLEMPRLNTYQVKFMQQCLLSGKIDLNKNISKKDINDYVRREYLNSSTDSGKDLSRHIIESSIEYIEPIKLKPIQYEIFVEQILDFFVNYKNPRNVYKNVIYKKPILTSNDNHTIDGHHRLAVSLLMGIDIKIPIIKVDLDWKKLFNVADYFTDILQNERNK